MGKGIVYCRDCGKSLREDDFVKNRAQTVDDVPYCTACRPLDRTPPTGSIKKIVPRTTKVPTAATPRRAAAPAPARNRLPLLLGGCGAGLLLVVLVLVLISGGPTEEVAPAPAPVPQDPPALAALEAFAASSQDPDAILLRVDEARGALKGTPYEARLRKVEQRAVDLKAQKGARLDPFLASIRTLIGDDAEFRRRAEIEGMIRSASEIAGARADEVRKLQLEYQEAFGRAAQSACQAARDEAQKLAAGEDFAGAADRIGRVPAAFLASPSGQALPELRRQYLARLEETEKAARAWLEGERLPILEKKGEAHPQDMKPFAGAWSQGIQLWWRDVKPGDVLRLEFPSAVAGRRRVHFSLTAAPDYGIVKLRVNGEVVLDQVDCYAPKVAAQAEIAGEAILKKGANELSVEIVGSNPKAKPANHMFGLDYLRIE